MLLCATAYLIVATGATCCLQQSKHLFYQELFHANQLYGLHSLNMGHFLMLVKFAALDFCCPLMPNQSPTTHNEVQLESSKFGRALGCSNVNVLLRIEQSIKNYSPIVGFLGASVVE